MFSVDENSIFCGQNRQLWKFWIDYSQVHAEIWSEMKTNENKESLFKIN